MKTLATQRSLAYLRKHGWQVAIVEKWLPARGKMKFGRRIDVWQFGDLLACRHQRLIDPASHPLASDRMITIKEIALIQCFPEQTWNEHVKKLKQPEIAAAIHNWKMSGGHVFLHGWRKRNKGAIRGARKEWQLREEIV